MCFCLNLIVSPKNEMVKQTKKLLLAKNREKTGLMILEGVRLIETALQAGIIFKYFLYNEQVLRNERGQKLMAYIEKAKLRHNLVSDNIINEISSTESSQGILGVAEKPRVNINEILAVPNPLILITDQIRDPGNLGTIIRSADAAGCSGVICGKGTVDITNPKVLRSTMGSIFHLPVVAVSDLREQIISLKEKGIQVVAADSRGDYYYHQLDLKKPTAIILGNEANGISVENLVLTDKSARIPILGKAESLNVAIAASLFIYEAVRQRFS